MSKIETLVEELATPVCEELGMSLYDVEYKKEGPDYFLRIFIAKEGGVGIDDCEAVSRKMSDLLDAADPIAEAYNLEVSSPGIERVLRKEAHFLGAIGEEVELKLFAPMDGKKVLSGTLSDFRDGTIILTVGNETASVPLEKCAQAKTVFHFGNH